MNKVRTYLSPYKHLIQHALSRGKVFRRSEAASPTHLTLAFTFRCMSACPHCFFIQKGHDFNPHDLLHENTLRKMFESRYTHSLSTVTCSGGEALLHPRFFDLLRLLPAQNLKSIQLVTNGLPLQFDNLVTALLRDTTLTGIHISLDAVDENIYKMKKGIKQCDFEKILTHMRTLASVLKGKKTVGVGFIVYNNEVSNILRMIHLAEQLGMDYCHIGTLHSVSAGNTMAKELVTQVAGDYMHILNNNSYSVEITVQPPLLNGYLGYYCESLANHLTVSPSGCLAVCCHIPWKSEVGSIYDDKANPLNNAQSQEFRRRFIQAGREESMSILPEECQYCNGRLNRKYYFSPAHRRWFVI